MYSCRSIVAGVLAAAAAAAPPAGAQPLLPARTPAYFPPAYRAALAAPLPAAARPQSRTGPDASAKTAYDSGLIPNAVPQHESDQDVPGAVGTDLTSGATPTKSNAFFQSFGQNGRACITCHQPPSGMSVSLTNIQSRANATRGADPIFAPVDGADCPSLVTAGAPFNTAHSLLLGKGLFRIFLPVPAQTIDAPPHPVEYTIAVVSDPNGCNTDPLYSTSTDPVTGVVTQMISVYRRPQIAANLGFKTTTSADAAGAGPAIDPTYGTPIPNDPNTGLPESGNIMADGREPTLQSQAIDATLGHAQAIAAPTAAQVDQMVQFETTFFSAQVATLLSSGSLNLASGALGGPIVLATVAPGQHGSRNGGAFNLFNQWSTDAGTSVADLQRESIYRGQQLFNTRQFSVSGVAGFNNQTTGKANTASCSTCHGELDGGSDNVPDAQKDLGIGGDQQSLGGPAPSPDLPIFRVTCNSGFSTFFLGTSVLTNDPGLALITGRCSDVGRLTTPQLRALAAHPPYFTDGSAPTLAAVVSFYNTRFHMNLTSTEQQDLVNFLNAL